jgi:hypothetical protein
VAVGHRRAAEQEFGHPLGRLAALAVLFVLLAEPFALGLAVEVAHDPR